MQDCKPFLFRIYETSVLIICSHALLVLLAVVAARLNKLGMWIVMIGKCKYNHELLTLQCYMQWSATLPFTIRLYRCCSLCSNKIHHDIFVRTTSWQFILASVTGSMHWSAMTEILHLRGCCCDNYFRMGYLICTWSSVSCSTLSMVILTIWSCLDGLTTVKSISSMSRRVT